MGGALTAVLLLATAAQESDFESPDFGVKLKIPKGWTIDATRQAGVIVKLTLPAEAGGLKPEILVYQAGFADPITPSQYKEQLRHYLQRVYKEPWMLDDRSAKAGGREGFLLSIQSRAVNNSEIVSHKGLFQTSPRRFLGVDGIFPKAQNEALSKAYEAFLGTIEFIPKRQAVGAESGIKQFEEALAKLVQPFGAPGSDELGVFLGEKEVGTQVMTWKAAAADGAEGVELTLHTKIDLGDDGRSDAKVTAFLASDFSRQSVQIQETRVGKDKRAQSFSATAAMFAGEVKVDARINGERVDTSFKVPARAVFSELLDLVQRRLLSNGKGFVVVPVVQAFDHDPSMIKVEVAGAHKMRVDEQTVDVQVVYQAREDGSLMTYWYDAERRLTRVTNSGQGPVFKRKK